ncbi:YecA family protein [Paraburkholderia phymatum]|uniref:YecA family protein n=1 Tax=Paraburkholderia phymatum TaxID=148447 RepID=A0ACC6UBJ9_9BURK
MNLDPEFDDPLTDEEFGVLERFLSSNAVCDDAMDAVMLHGFLTAVISGPNMVMPSAVLPWIWDARHATRQPRFLSAGRARKITGLIIQHWNDINNALNHCPDLFEPPLHTTEWRGEEILVLNEWCEGYCKGIDIDREAWELLIERHPEWFNVILLFGTASGYQALGQRDYTVEQRRSFANLLTAAALNIHRYWGEERRKLMEQGERPNMIPPVSRPKEHAGRGDPDAQDGNESEDLFLVDSLGRTTEDAFHPLALSPLSTSVTREGTSVDVHVYRAGNDSRDGWILEIIDSHGTSTVWDDPFPTDGAALAEALNTINSHGIASVTAGVPEHVTKH